MPIRTLKLMGRAQEALTAARKMHTDANNGLLLVVCRIMRDRRVHGGDTAAWLDTHRGQAALGPEFAEIARDAERSTGVSMPEKEREKLNELSTAGDIARALNEGEEKIFGHASGGANNVVQTMMRRYGGIPEENIVNWTMLGPHFREIIAETESGTEHQALLDNPSAETTFVELVYAVGG